MLNARLETNHGVSFLTCAPLHEHAVIRHAFGTRLGGVSAPPYASLNQGFGSGDDRALVQDNRARFGRAVGINVDALVVLRQVHGKRIVILDERSDPRRVRGTPGDGLITNVPGIALGVITADCFPIAIAAPSVPAAGIVHAGRSGIAQGIVSIALEQLVQRFQVSAEAVFVAIGPGIGRCCYEVDDASAEPFQATFAPHAGVYHPSRPGHQYLDLQQAILLQVCAAGVPVAQVRSADLCTACHPHWFFSYRREGPRSGRMMNVVMIRLPLGERYPEVLPLVKAEIRGGDHLGSRLT